MILDRYFKRPLIWDFFMALLLSVIGFILVYKNIIFRPQADDSIAIITDITNISLTMSGFILTLLTVLITFKGSSKITKVEVDSKEPLFDLFFVTGLYHETVRHLKNCIKSLIIVAIIGFTIKIFSPESLKTNIFYFNIFGFTVIMLTITRCLLILGKVMDLQKENDEKNNE
ncbi:hypothetical protein D0809_04090 [Flavobacterium circumlabens]|uniref:Uncharacterized protein n=1 Tax=Flavobacterium circumlabens TaxID=2133765 RepID=A0A4Y7UJ09_9FLAO|nr:hypothetical protein [Flavobacterium circumlabens]TCN61068.1 hypothetical protein EV142_101655 [Flavobacterium circumlabens]TEB46181.1 hypothetical protein D0809_04090 [Flavobacterium circumlabens]